MGYWNTFRWTLWKVVHEYCETGGRRTWRKTSIEKWHWNQHTESVDNTFCNWVETSVEVENSSRAGRWVIILSHYLYTTNVNTTQNQYNKSKLTQSWAFKMSAKGLLSRYKIWITLTSKKHVRAPKSLSCKRICPIDCL